MCKDACILQYVGECVSVVYFCGAGTHLTQTIISFLTFSGPHHLNFKSAYAITADIWCFLSIIQPQ